MMDYRARNILKTYIDIDKAFKLYPDLFHLKSCSVQQKIDLIICEPDMFFEHIGKLSLSADQRLDLLRKTTDKKVHALFALSDSDIDRLSPAVYADLLETNFKKYISLARYEKLSKSYQEKVFIKNPNPVFKLTGKLPERLTSQGLLQLAQNNPSFVSKNIRDFSNLKTESYFWIKMIGYNYNVYTDLFMKNTNSLINKSEVRYVFYKCPELIKLITPEFTETSKLTIKEWALLCNNIIKDDRNEKHFKYFSFSKELIEHFDLNQSVCALMGTSSKVLSRATKNLKSKA